jgi:hypothetical protein
MYGLDVFKLIMADAAKIAALKASANELENVHLQCLSGAGRAGPGYSRGQTLVDRRVTGGEDDVHQGTRKHWPRVDVAMETVPEKVLDLFSAPSPPENRPREKKGSCGRPNLAYSPGGRVSSG